MTDPLPASVAILKALAHPARLRMLAMLRGGELCVCQMTAVLDLAASTVSAHLADLKRAGLVGERKEGRFVVYRLETSAGCPADLKPLWAQIGRDPQVQADEQLLRDLKQVSVEELCRVELDLARIGIRRPRSEPVRTRRRAG